MDEELTTWSCEIGSVDRASLPDGADHPMREAVEEAYLKLTGKEPDFTSSGWGKKASE